MAPEGLLTNGNAPRGGSRAVKRASATRRLRGRPRLRSRGAQASPDSVELMVDFNHALSLAEAWSAASDRLRGIAWIEGPIRQRLPEDAQKHSPQHPDAVQIGENFRCRARHESSPRARATDTIRADRRRSAAGNAPQAPGGPRVPMSRIFFPGRHTPARGDATCHFLSTWTGPSASSPTLAIEDERCDSGSSWNRSGLGRECSEAYRWPEGRARRAQARPGRGRRDCTCRTRIERGVIRSARRRR